VAGAAAGLVGGALLMHEGEEIRASIVYFQNNASTD
jgi:hypothetical protein